MKESIRLKIQREAEAEAAAERVPFAVTSSYDVLYVFSAFFCLLFVFWDADIKSLLETPGIFEVLIFLTFLAFYSAVKKRKLKLSLKIGEETLFLGLLFLFFLYAHITSEDIGPEVFAFWPPFALARFGRLVSINEHRKARAKILYEQNIRIAERMPPAAEDEAEEDTAMPPPARHARRAG